MNELQEKLVTDNLGLVRYIARAINATNVDYEDVISEGTIGLIKASTTFDESKHVKFSTYATSCIRNEILIFLRKENKHSKLKSIEEMLYEDDDGNKLVLADLLSDKGNYYEEKETIEVIENALNWMFNLRNSRMRTVLLLECAGVKQNEIGSILGLSQSCISRMNKRANESLKKCVDGKKIYNQICDCVKIESFYRITFYTQKLKDAENILESIRKELKKIKLEYFNIEKLDNINFSITVLNEDNSIIFLANLLNQIA